MRTFRRAPSSASARPRLRPRASSDAGGRPSANGTRAINRGRPIPSSRPHTLRIALLSTIPGRARLGVEGLRGNHRLAARVERAILSHGAVHELRVSVVTGNVLLRFDPRRAELRALMLTLARGAVASSIPATARAPAAVRLGRWHALPLDEVVGRLSADPAVGLSASEAALRLAEEGPNRLPVPRPKSALTILCGHVTSLPVLLLGCAAGLSILSGAVIDAVVILAVVGLNATVGYVTESRVERILTSLQQASGTYAFARRDGRETIVAAEELVPGDVVELKAGHAIPADIRLLDAQGLAVDESTLTGESLPVMKWPRSAVREHAPLAERLNMAYAGTVVAEGGGLGVVVGTGATTEVGRIRVLVGSTDKRATPLERQLDGLGRRLVAASLGFCGVTLALGLVRGLPALEMLRSVVSLGVAAVPEGLPAVATTTLALGVQRMMANRTLVRRLGAIEALGATTVICADKTGTLTENRMAVHGWYLGMREYWPRGDSEPDQLLSRALAVSALCNEAELHDVQNRINGAGSSTESALLAAALDQGLDYRRLRLDYPRVGLRARADGANWMGTIHETPRGRRLVAVKGAPTEVLARAAWWFDGAQEQPLTTAERRAIVDANARLAGQGTRVLGLAFAETAAGVEARFDGLVWLGLVALTDPVRPGVAAAMAACRAAGIRVVMITGDQAPTATAIYRLLAPDDNAPLRVHDATGLAATDEATIRELVRHVDVFARVSPGEKYQIVRALQANGNVVLMTGDGINDAAALRAADIGVAMGARGTDVARDVADVVLLDDDLGAIVTAVAQGRTIHTNIDKALRFLLATNFSEILVTLGALALGVGQSMSPIQFLWINLVSDVLPALALAVEPPETDVLRRPPRSPSAEVIDRAALTRIGADAAVLAASTLGVHGLSVVRYGSGPRTTTLSFLTLTAAQLLYGLTCRSRVANSASPGARHPLLAGVVGGTLALQVATTLLPPLRRLLGTVPLSAGDWGLVGVGVGLPTLFTEIRCAFSASAAEPPTHGGGPHDAS